jgi:hypothetical protein
MKQSGETIELKRLIHALETYNPVDFLRVWAVDDPRLERLMKQAEKAGALQKCSKYVVDTIASGLREELQEMTP